MNEINKQTNKYKWAAERIRKSFPLTCEECVEIPADYYGCLKLQEDECKKDQEALKIAIRILEIAAMYTTSKESENLEDALDRGELSLNE